MDIRAAGRQGIRSSTLPSQYPQRRPSSPLPRSSRSTTPAPRAASRCTGESGTVRRRRARVAAHPRHRRLRRIGSRSPSSPSRWACRSSTSTSAPSCRWATPDGKTLKELLAASDVERSTSPDRADPRPDRPQGSSPAAARRAPDHATPAAASWTSGARPDGQSPAASAARRRRLPDEPAGRGGASKSRALRHRRNVILTLTSAAGTRGPGRDRRGRRASSCGFISNGSTAARQRARVELPRADRHPGRTAGTPDDRRPHPPLPPKRPRRPAVCTRSSRRSRRTSPPNTSRPTPTSATWSSTSTTDAAAIVEQLSLSRDDPRPPAPGSPAAPREGPRLPAQRGRRPCRTVRSVAGDRVRLPVGPECTGTDDPTGRSAPRARLRTRAKSGGSDVPVAILVDPRHQPGHLEVHPRRPSPPPRPPPPGTR